MDNTTLIVNNNQQQKVNNKNMERCIEYKNIVSTLKFEIEQMEELVSTHDIDTISKS